uniref:Uncharacterized protein n=1 Tax=Cannabis sativa TaxID=3483 RepID=A0A803P042_CANSA
MAILFTATGFVHGSKINHHALPLPNSFFFLGFSLSSRNFSPANRLLSSPVRFHRRQSLSFSLRATKPGQPPPSPPESDPPPGTPPIKERSSVEKEERVLQTLVMGDGIGSNGGRIGGGAGDGRGSGGGDGDGSGFFEGNNNRGSNSTDVYYQKMIEANPGNGLLLGNYAKFLKEVRGDYAKAEEYCGRAILANPGDAEILSLYADLIWTSHKDVERAENYFDQAVKSSPDDW